MYLVLLISNKYLHQKVSCGIVYQIKATILNSIFLNKKSSKTY